jgi:hypothetical protein
MIPNKKVVQTLVFPKEDYSRRQALDWAKRHGFKHYTSRETAESIRVRQLPPAQIDRVLGTFNVGPKVKAVYVKRK